MTESGGYNNSYNWSTLCDEEWDTATSVSAETKDGKLLSYYHPHTSKELNDLTTTPTHTFSIHLGLDICYAMGTDTEIFKADYILPSQKNL
jgi:hypothetical protein